MEVIGFGVAVEVPADIGAGFIATKFFVSLHNIVNFPFQFRDIDQSVQHLRVDNVEIWSLYHFACINETTSGP